jgi:exodeoxyribonuclease VII large subunit
MSQPSFDFVHDVGTEPTFSVPELVSAANQVLKRGFGDGAWVRGEVEGLSSRGGHTYFSLCGLDDDGNRATVSVALFANTAYRLRGMLARHRLELRNGLAVRLHLRPDVFARTGRLTFVVQGLDPTFTLGQLAADRDELLRRLAAEGLVGRNRQRRLVAAPLVLGLVTSRHSAAYHDLVHELQASGIGFELRVADVRVQGDGAEAGVAAAVRALGASGVDAVLLVRGGGARSDLATFDAEAVARAIAACPVPVLTGLGHEIDRSVADEVAHTALKTPTACAAFVVGRVQEAAARAEEAWAGIERLAQRALTAANHDLALVTRAVAGRSVAVVDRATERVHGHQARLRRAGQRGTGREQERLGARQERLRSLAERALRPAEGQLAVLDARLRAVDPAVALARGWSITRRVDGSLVRSAAAVEPGARLVTHLADGTVTSTVESADLSAPSRSQP